MLQLGRWAIAMEVPPYINVGKSMKKNEGGFIPGPGSYDLAGNGHNQIGCKYNYFNY